MSTCQHGNMQAPLTGGNRHGYAIAMTVFSLLRPGGEYFQRLVFALGRLSGSLDIDRLATIHFARLALIREFHDHGQGPDDLWQPLQLFESNYNGSFGQYVDTFVDQIPVKMHDFWGTSFGFPWPLRPGRFKRYIDANEFQIDHYYVANPEASVKMVSSALRIAFENAKLLREAPRLDPNAFAHRLRQLVTAFQPDL